MKHSFSILLLLSMIAALTACSGATKKKEADIPSTSIDAAASKLSLGELEAAALALRVAFDRSVDTWQGSTDQAIPGCHIPGEVAERGLQELRPWIDRRAAEEAKKLLANPKNYRLPINEESCAADCTCGVGLRVLEAAKLDELSHSKMKDWKRVRAQLEAKAELQTSERSELCAEGITWICKSDLLSAIKASAP
ncbi:MAG: hypothetical protein JNJ49_15440 [Bdellovibrionaceae bacterium]|nr:hypothetical protein [Pseudobdellovibrionaceae bacterium]